jgi:hypothetical protein
MGVEVTIEAIEPHVVIEQVADDAQMHISAPPAPQLVMSEAGIQGAAGVGATIYEASFSNLSSWTVNHNLGRKPAGISLLTLGQVEFDADIVHLNDNQFVVVMEQPFSGIVRVM